MKIDCEQPTPISPITLDDLYYGTVFRPMGSHRVFILTNKDGDDKLLSSVCSELKLNIEEFDHHFNECCQDYKDLLLCVSLDTGDACLIDAHTSVEELDYSFVIKGNK